MIGNFRWNLGLGIVGFAVIFMSSWSNNLFSTTLMRSLYGFAILFILTFAIRWLLGTVVGLNRIIAPASVEENPGAGQAVDLTTPQEDDSLHHLIKQNIGRPPEGGEPADVSFAPLKPPKLVSQLREEEPLELANAVRRLTEE